MQRPPLLASPRLNGAWGDGHAENTVLSIRFLDLTEPSLQSDGKDQLCKQSVGTHGYEIRTRSSGFTDCDDTGLKALRQDSTCIQCTISGMPDATLLQ